MIAFDAMRAALGLGETAEVWRPRWDASAPSFRPGAGPFMDEASLAETCTFLNLSGECAQALRESVAMFRENLPLQRLAWHLLRTELLEATPDRAPNTHRWPMLPEGACPAAGMFYALVFLSAVPHVRDLHALRGIREEITRDTLTDLEVWMRDHRTRTGRWGLDQLAWFREHFAGRLFRLGRLQFMPEPFAYDIRFFSDRHDAVIALAETGCRFREDGQFDGADGVTDPRAWVAELTCGRQYCGSPVSADGRARHETIRLDASEWMEALRKGDTILGVHIPASGALDFDQCGESFRRALAFFPRYFPEWDLHAFACTSWMLDPQLALYLP